ncbi:mitochondrial carrier [Microthyrium microscopicum]|uniref:Mitochondrial carrier n=1 Tax=Microthyrium microscopicum TaxID=703497 RepID=A0A6A6U5U6_9PEZI|nr:mitochondrial carrier [Microthyrium microscopicum]
MANNGGHPNTTSDILLAGAFAAFTIDLLIYPLDTIKTRLQSKNYATRYLLSSGAYNRPALFRGVYQGLGSVIVATLPSSGAFFLTYESTKSLLTTTTTLPLPLLHALSSATAELVSCAILTPAEVIKQNAQIASTSSSSSLSVLRQFFRQRPSALFRGYTALAARNLPFTAMQFPVFEALRARVRKGREDRGLWTGTLGEQAVVTGVCAGVAGAGAAAVTTPVDVVKTRVMLAAAEEGGQKRDGGDGREKIRGADGKVEGRKTLSEVKVFKEIWREGGVKELFRGGALRSVWTMVGSGLYLGVYDFGRVYLARRRGEKVDMDDLE